MAALSLKQVILYVQDMHAQVAFYRDVMGLQVRYPQLEDHSSEQWVVLDAGGVELALHAGGKRDFGTDTPCLVFLCTDIKATHAELTQRGVKLDAIFSPAPGTLVSNGRDPEGNRFSIKQLQAPA